ncbi:hypothetical protein Sango_1914400 [Sesamum angolense]|uniref:Reverse transcriptase/retrotransposon-derived protein RNase H-like domain-containing protein n=1 Tax=Sesamum angolense TaxID=2727404 RepID=A0AAE1WDS8_9LAMI|nr:hypothetical protein Sango_1914400 [Sesamum angolense]
MWSKRSYSPRLPQKCGELRKIEATNDILDAVYYGDLVPIYQFEDLPSDESVYEEETETDSDGSSTEKEYIEIPKISKEFAKQPVVRRYEGMLQNAGYEILVAGVAGRENGSMTLGQQGLIDSDSFYEESEKEIKNLKETFQELKTMDISEESKFSLKNVKRLIQRNFRNKSAKWKWEEFHTQRVRELKQVCNNLPKLAIPQDEDELVVYTDANDYRWAVVLMKMTTTGEEPCRYTGGLFTEQQAQMWHINEKEFLAV